MIADHGYDDHKLRLHQGCEISDYIPVYKYKIEILCHHQTIKTI
jgi:hypothetical protein